jgi:hypothetical protein
LWLNGNEFSIYPFNRNGSIADSRGMRMFCNRNLEVYFSSQFFLLCLMAQPTRTMLRSSNGSWPEYQRMVLKRPFFDPIQKADSLALFDVSKTTTTGYPDATSEPFLLRHRSKETSKLIYFSLAFSIRNALLSCTKISIFQTGLDGNGEVLTSGFVAPKREKSSSTTRQPKPLQAPPPQRRGLAPRTPPGHPTQTPPTDWTHR